MHTHKHTCRYTGTGCSHSILANRISFLLGLTGPSLVVDTACSSSLVALHVAKNALLKGECSTAIVASADLMLSSYSLNVRHRAGMLSQDGTCRPFDAQANGYVRGEGAVCIILKRVSNLRKGETVLSFTIFTNSCTYIHSLIYTHTNRYTQFFEDQQ